MNRVIVIEGPDGAGKSTLVKAIKAADPSVETMHPGKPPKDYSTLLRMLNDQLQVGLAPNRVYDRLTCISEWVYRPFRIDINDNQINEQSVYVSLLEAHIVLSMHMKWTIVYCRPDIDTILEHCDKFTEHDTEETIAVVKMNIADVVQRYDVLMTQLALFGCQIVQYDYSQQDTFEFIKEILE